MSEFAQGPGWWRASDGRWYPPEQHPSYQPVPPPPPVRSAPVAAAGYPYAPPPAAARQPAHLSITATTWLVALGALGVFISVFLTWATATVDLGFGVTTTGTADLTGVGKFVGVVVAVGVVALCAPVFVGGAVSRKRVIGLTVVLAIFTVLAGVWTANAGHALHGASNETPDVGAFVCWTAIVLIWIAVVRLWVQPRSPVQGRMR